MDNSNIAKWLSGYEILLSNGYNLTNFQNREWKQFIAELRQKNVAALFIKLSYFVDELPQEIIDYTVELDFPVVVVPNDYAWITITDPIHQYILQKQLYFINESTHLRDQMNKIMLQNGSLTDICTASAENLSRPVAVFDQCWNLLASSDDPQWEQVEHRFHGIKPRPYDTLENVELEKYHNYQLETPFGRVVYIPLPDPTYNKYIAVIQDNNFPGISLADTYKFDHIAVAVLLQLCKEAELSRIEKHYYDDFLLDLMDGILTRKNEIDAKTKRLERKIYAAYQLIVFDIQMAEPTKKNLVDELLFWFKEEDSLVRDIMVCHRGPQVVLFQPVGFSEDRQLIAKACQIVSQHFDNAAMQFGISRCYDLTNIHPGYQEAQFALSTQRFVNRQLIYYDDLGLLRLFEINAKKADIPFLTHFYSETIQPLAVYDIENRTNLVQTLEFFFKHDLSISSTAKGLYIHENTLRARIRRIETMLDRSLKTPMDIAELLIGIQIHAFIEFKEYPNGNLSAHWTPLQKNGKQKGTL